MVSAKPSVVITAARAACPVSRAFKPAVVPCPNRSTAAQNSPEPIPKRAAARSIASRIPVTMSGVVGAFTTT